MLRCLIIGLTGLLAGACGSPEPPPGNVPAADTRPYSRTDLRIIGSSTVYPFATKVAQEYRYKTGQNVVVESTGSGGGHKLFCEGSGPSFPDIVNSSRRQKPSEFDLCAANGVAGLVEVLIGYDGIVIARSAEAASINLTLDQIYLAFAKDIPAADGSCNFVRNPHERWSDISPTLPDTPIETYGPPPTSGTRDAFVEIAMEGGARRIPCLARLEASDRLAFERMAHTLREDGRWIDAGESDNAIIQTLVNTPSAFGVFGYSFLDQNLDRISAATVDAAKPNFENIRTGAYPISRSLYLYLKKQHVDLVPGVQDFALEFLSDEASAPGGYLEEIGLVPLNSEKRIMFRQMVLDMEAYKPR